ncbi:hypothetical protein ACTFIU_000008 [Dictyostelium citrinum]
MKYSVCIIPLILIILVSIGIKEDSKRMYVVMQSIKVSLLVLLVSIFVEEWTYVKLNGHLIKTPLIGLFEVILVVVVYIIIYLFEMGIKEGKKIKITEEAIILMYSSVIGMLISMEAHNLITLFLSLEISRGMASTIILLGIVSIYKSTGSLMYTDILVILMEGPTMIQSQMGIALLVLGLFIKLGIAPFHGWLIDTYEGSGLLMTFFLTITQKIVTIIVLINLYKNMIAYVNVLELNKVIVILIITTLIVGTIGCLRQQKIIRFIAYSAIVNSALLILFFAGENIEELLTFSIYYLINYIIGLTILISLLMGVNTKNKGNMELLVEFKNTWLNNKVIAICFVIVLLHLAGLPPFTNFISKDKEGELLDSSKMQKGGDVVAGCIISRMDILKDLNIKERINEMGIAIPRGEAVSLKLNKKEEILGTIIKHRGSGEGAKTPGIDN